MKTKAALLILFFLSIYLNAQTEKDYFISINETKIGGYIGLGGRYSTVTNSENAGFLDYKIALTIDGKWGFGLSGSGMIHNERKLSDLVTDGTYRLYINYGTFFVERIFTLTRNFKLSISLSSGYGETYYQYDKEYRKEKLWTDEVIDKTTFYIFEPGLEVQHRISGNWWIGLNAFYRNTSPVELANTNKNFLRKFSTGVTFKYGLF